MQKRFLAVAESLKDPTMTLSGLWLLHSDEPLMIQWLIDACHPIWQANHQVMKRIDITSPKSWHEVTQELVSLSLFEESTAIILSGKHKPDDATLSQLIDFANDAKAGTSTHHLIWLLSKQDKKSQNTKVFKLFDQHGLIIHGTIQNESERHALLMAKAQDFKLSLTPDAWQMLMSHTQHDLLTAYQTLWRLSYAHTLPSQSQLSVIDVPDLSTLLSEGGVFSVFDLSDALIQRQPNQCLKIINYLYQTNTATSIILWAISKDIHLIAALRNGQDPQKLGIWRNKVLSYQNLANNISDGIISHWLTQVYETDKAIKGLSQDNAWRLIRQLVLSICGINMQGLHSHDEW